ncbi:hypothetical protein BJ170DRAFT_684343 [Xylariales sp. AK1849]|nr:hypothetical protein BJ170DRAFT_684343 [Xylariales sp. AK1849]
MAGRLLLIPNEVLLMVCSYLGVEDQGALRLSCKGVEQAILHQFARQRFMDRRFMLTEFSLNALLGISRSKFSSSLRRVTLIPTFFDPRKLNPHAPQNAAQKKAFLDESTNQAMLLHSGQDIALLHEAFSGLSCIEIVGVEDRQGPNTAYGAKTVEAKIGGLFMSSHDSSEFKSICVIKLLRTLGTSKSHPKTLEFRLGGGPVYGYAFDVPTYMKRDIQPVLSALDQLSVHIGYCLSSYRSITPTDQLSEVDTFSFRIFLSLLTGLKCLRICRAFDRDDQDPNIASGEWLKVGQDRDFMRWLSDSSLEKSRDMPRSELIKPPPSVTFSHLRQLDLGSCNAMELRPEVLVSLVDKFQPTLRRLSLYVMLERVNRDLEYEPRKRHSYPRRTIWRDVLLGMCSSNLQLEYILITEPTQMENLGYAVEGSCFFGTFADSGARQRPYTVVREGQRTMLEIKDLASKAILVSSSRLNRPSGLSDTKTDDTDNDADENDSEEDYTDFDNEAQQSLDNFNSDSDEDTSDFV